MRRFSREAAKRGPESSFYSKLEVAKQTEQHQFKVGELTDSSFPYLLRDSAASRENLLCFTAKRI
jgi:hypothetical protein